jgi:hypothetical protein
MSAIPDLTIGLIASQQTKEMIGNSVDVVIHVEADLKKAAPATP